MLPRHASLLVLALALSGCAGAMPSVFSSAGGNAGEVQIADLSSAGTEPPLPERRNPPASKSAAIQGKAVPASASGKSFLATFFSTPPGTASVSQPSGPEQVYVDADPISVYARLASHIKGCWLNRAHPALANHKFSAAADPGGTAAITLYQSVEGAKLGIVSFRIGIAKDGSGSTVRSENVKLPDAIKGAMLLDIANWAKGQDGCATRSVSASSSSQVTAR